MVEYYCQACDFKTERKSTYNDHLKSKKHLNKTTGVSTSECTNNDCSESRIKELESLLLMKDSEIAEYKLQLKHKDDIISILKQQSIEPQNVKLTVKEKPKQLSIAEQLEKARPDAFTIQECEKLLFNSEYNNYILSTEGSSDGKEYIILNQSKIKHTEYKDRGIDNAIDILTYFFEDIPENKHPFYCSNKRKNTLYIKTTNGWIKQPKENKTEFDKIILNLAKQALNSIQRAMSSIFLLFNNRKQTFYSIYNMNYDDWNYNHRSEMFNVLTLFGDDVSARFKSDQEQKNEELVVKLLKVQLSKMSCQYDWDDEE